MKSARLSPAVQLAPHDDAAFGETDFFAHLSLDVPACRYNGGRDELGANVALGQRFFVHADVIPLRGILPARWQAAGLRRLTHRPAPSAAVSCSLG
jgi:hypothetical protein